MIFDFNFSQYFSSGGVSNDLQTMSSLSRRWNWYFGTEIEKIQLALKYISKGISLFNKKRYNMWKSEVGGRYADCPKITDIMHIVLPWKASPCVLFLTIIRTRENMKKFNTLTLIWLHNSHLTFISFIYYHHDWEHRFSAICTLARIIFVIPQILFNPGLTSFRFLLFSWFSGS